MMSDWQTEITGSFTKTFPKNWKNKVGLHPKSLTFVLYILFWRLKGRVLRPYNPSNRTGWLCFSSHLVTSVSAKNMTALKVLRSVFVSSPRSDKMAALISAEMRSRGDFCVVPEHNLRWAEKKGKSGPSTGGRLIWQSPKCYKRLKQCPVFFPLLFGAKYISIWISVLMYS